jgi:hypothetical protein
MYIASNNRMVIERLIEEDLKNGSLSDLRYLTGICLEELNKNTKNLRIVGISARIRIRPSSTQVKTVTG